VRLSWVVALLWLAAPLAPSPALAVDCKIAANSAGAALTGILTARALGCFGGAQDQDALAIQVNKTTTPANCKPPTRTALENLRSTLSGMVGDIDQDLLANSGSEPPDWHHQTAVLMAQLRAAQAKIDATEGIPEAAYWQWSVNDGHQLFQQTDASYLLDYEPLIRAACEPPGSGCASAVATAVRLNRAAGLAAQASQCADQARLEGARRTLAYLDAQWDRYFFKTRSQYVWELALNSWRFKDKPNEFAKPPVDQVIFLHPEAAFEYVGGGARNQRSYDAIVMAEIIGYNRFTWAPKKDGSSSALPPLGLAIVTTYSPYNTGDRFGFGLMLHVYNTLSIGATRRNTGSGKQTTYLLSADLMRLILNPSREAMARFRGTGAPPP